jgi:putative tryptophan/tyrosine transport system substrate-binding protein
MTRNIFAFICLLLTILLLTGFPAQAQQSPKVPRIGYVTETGDLSSPSPNLEAFRQGLRDLGYVEGKNIVIEFRSAEGKPDRIPSLVAELVQLNVDILVSQATGGIRAAKQATKTIPIVMVTVQDPVATGLIDSLSRPGGNITGLSRLTVELSGQRLELLKEVVPGISRVGMLWDADGSSIGVKGYEAQAPALKIQLQSLEVRGPNPDFEGAFQAAAKGGASALITVTGGLLNRYPKPIADLAIQNRMPSMYERSPYVEAGGLVSYAPNDADSYRRAATYVDKILKGAKPGDLPIEQPTKFELVINLKTAKQIGVTIPPNVLARADKVIK